MAAAVSMAGHVGISALIILCQHNSHVGVGDDSLLFQTGLIKKLCVLIEYHAYFLNNESIEKHCKYQIWLCSLFSAVSVTRECATRFRSFLGQPPADGSWHTATVNTLQFVVMFWKVVWSALILCACHQQGVMRSVLRQTNTYCT